MFPRAFLALLLGAALLPAAVKKIYVVERTDAPRNYERITAKAHFAIDPRLPANQIIRDIGMAPRNAEGLVEFSADLEVLKPTDPAKGNGTILYEVSNRGGKGMLNMFERDGDQYLLEQGYTLVWLGWQSDLPTQGSLLRLEVPKAKGATGIVRSEYVPSVKVDVYSLGDRTMQAYPVSDPNDPATQMTVRDAPDGPRRVIPRAQWRFVDETRVGLTGGFQPGKLYDVIYRAKDPAIVGLGMAATRDIISFLKGKADGLILLGDQGRYYKNAIGFGTSQSGRFLRTFLYMGFNKDENGRRVFDGVWAHVGGAGRGSFNHRFAQPSRDGHRMTNTFYPSDVFPFADLRMMDPETKDEDGLLAKAQEENVLPRVFYTNGSYEYWGRAASLIHTSVDGKRDDGVSGNSRVYYLTGTQHGPGRWPAAKTSETTYPANPNDYRFLMRGLLGAFTAWVAKNEPPPASNYPRIDKQQLVAPAALNFPKIPGVRLPRAPNLAWRVDYGPDFKELGIISIDPPKVGKPFPVMVPAVDADGNELAGLRLPDVSVPLGTYTGWNLRDPATGSPAEMQSMTGGYHPFAQTKAEREAAKDPRLSIEERYASKEDYLAKVDAALDALVSARYILERDKPALRERAASHWR
ncbi:MAG: alpha/beta hydrolase domain-containing protein [Acidobacteria bacterium]|nr:alpha/beta hydrolase domain-containing protein [Acidobacteriota bacterium]